MDDSITLSLFQYRVQYFLFIDLFGAEEPVIAGHVLLFFHALFGGTVRAGRGNDHVIARLPVGRGGNEYNRDSAYFYCSYSI